MINLQSIVDKYFCHPLKSPGSPEIGRTLDRKKLKESRIPKEPENGDYMSWDSNTIHKINHKIFLLMLIGGFLLIPRVFLNKRLLAQSVRAEGSDGDTITMCGKVPALLNFYALCAVLSICRCTWSTFNFLCT